MGTRGAFGFRRYGIDKVTYNHWDSYPECLGEKMARFCVEHKAELASICDSIILVAADSEPSFEAIAWAKLAGCINTEVSYRTEKDWYCLLRELQGGLHKAPALVTATGKYYMIDNHEFLKDSLFCEYAYIINLDTNRLEYWVGFQEVPQEGNRYGTQPVPDHDFSKYYPCKLAAEFPLDGLDVDKCVADMNEIE